MYKKSLPLCLLARLSGFRSPLKYTSSSPTHASSPLMRISLPGRAPFRVARQALQTFSMIAAHVHRIAVPLHEFIAHVRQSTAHVSSSGVWRGRLRRPNKITASIDRCSAHVLPCAHRIVHQYAIALSPHSCPRTEQFTSTRSPAQRAAHQIALPWYPLETLAACPISD